MNRFGTGKRIFGGGTRNQTQNLPHISSLNGSWPANPSARARLQACCQTGKVSFRDESQVYKAFGNGPSG